MVEGIGGSCQLDATRTDTIIDPTGRTKFTDMNVATDFLKKTGKPPSTESIGQIIAIRESANLFKAARQ